MSTHGSSDDALARILRYQPHLTEEMEALVRVVATYLPRKVIRLATTVRNGTMLTVPLEGSVLFADVEGFTTMSEQFSQHDPNAGAEEVTDIVNRFLEVLITVAERYGGDLQKFGGDAGLILFTGQDYAKTAVAAALEVQQALSKKMSEVETSLGRFPLRVSIGIGSGKLIGVGIGDEVRREWFLSGSALRRMGEAEELAPSRGIAIDQQTALLCGEGLRSRPLEGTYSEVLGLDDLPAPIEPAPILRIPAIDEPARQLRALLDLLDTLTPYLAPGLMSRLTTLTQQMQLWSEHRQVTVMMVAMSGFPDLTAHWDDPAALRQAVEAPNTFFARSRAIIQRYDGLINKIGLSPHGPYLMALFGAPVAHEDEPLRAALAALELQEAGGHLLRIGLNSGFVFAGDVGTAHRREYTVMGDEVNLAHRLMSACAPGEIWAGPKTASHPAVQRHIEGTFAAPHRFKGKADLITPFVIHGRRAIFLGVDVAEEKVADRRVILRGLRNDLRAALEGHGSIALLHGDAGTGKSLVAAIIAREAHEEGCLVHTGTAPSYGEHLPYAAWEQPLRALLDLDEQSDDPAGDFLKAMERYGMAEQAPLLAPIVGVDLPPTPTLASLTAELRERQRRAAMRDLWLHAARERARLLILENAQWMPGATLSLLSAFLEEPYDAPLLILITYRNEGAPAVLESRKEMSHVHDYTFPAFQSRDLWELAHQQTGGGEIPKEVVRWLGKRSNGNPFFAAVALRSLITSGVLRRTNSHWEITQPLEEAPVPGTVYGLLQSRIDQLDPPSRHVLRAAAVVGDQMTLAMLNAAYGEEPLPLLRRRLDNLAPLGLIFSERGEETLIFRQPLIREVALQGLPKRIRIEIHRRLATYLNIARDAATSNWLTLLAHHAFEGQMWPLAFSSNLELGRRAFANHLTDQAIQALQRAIQAATEGELEADTTEAHLLLGQVMTIVGRYEEALEQFAEVRDRLPHPPATESDIHTAAVLAYHTAETLEKLSHYQEAFAQIEQGLAYPVIRQTLTAAQLLMIKAGIHYRIGELEASQVTAEEVIQRTQQIEGVEAQRVRARALNLMALIHYRQGNLQKARELGEAGLASFEALLDTLGEVRARSSLLLINLMQGHWAEAEKHGQKALALARRIRYAEGEAQILANLGEVYRLQGQWDKARRAYRQALLLAQEQNITYGIALMENNLAAVAIQQGYFDEAHEHLDRAEQLFQAIGSQRVLPELYRHRGRLAFREGDFETAKRWALRAIEEAEKHHAGQELLLSNILLADIESRLGSCEAAQTALAKAEGFLASETGQYGRGLLLLSKAHYALYCGVPEEARRHIDQAEVIFRQLGAQGKLKRLRNLAQRLASLSTTQANISSTLPAR